MPTFDPTGRPAKELQSTSTGTASIAQGTVSIDATGGWGATVDGPSSAASYRYSSSTSGYPADATVTSSGTVVNGRTFSITGGPLTFGDTIYITIIPFTGSSASGTALDSIHIRGAYLTYTASKTATYSATAWAERSPGKQWGIDWSGTLYPKNPTLPYGSIFYMWLFPILPAGVTLVQASVITSWATASVALATMTLAVYVNGTNVALDSPTYAGGLQTINMSLSGTLASATSVAVLTLWNGSLLSSADPDASSGQASSRDVAMTYTMPTPDKSI